MQNFKEVHGYDFKEGFSNQQTLTNNDAPVSRLILSLALSKLSLL